MVASQLINKPSTKIVMEMIEEEVSISSLKDEELSRLLEENVEKGILFQYGNYMLIFGKSFNNVKAYRISFFKQYKNCIGVENHIEFDSLDKMKSQLYDWLKLSKKCECKLIVLK